MSAKATLTSGLSGSSDSLMPVAAETRSEEGPCILIGCSAMRDILASTFSDLHFVLDNRSAVDLRDLQFPRDQAITRLDGIQLIPHSFEQTPLALSWCFLALLPSSSDHFITSVKSAYSTGFEASNTAYSVTFSEEHQLPYERASSCIEGGNCFLLMANDEPCAIVGCHSHVLSLLALEEQGYFVKNGEAVQTIAEQLAPSDWAVRMARNWHYHQEREPVESLKRMKHSLFGEYTKARDSVLMEELQSQIAALDMKLKALEMTQRWRNDTEFKRALQVPIQDEDRVTYQAEAKLFEAKLQLTKTVMAKDLGVPEKNLVVLPQKKFHLDMEMFLAPGNMVYVQDERLAQKELSEIRYSSRSFKTKIEHYRKDSETRAFMDQENNKQIAGVLSQIGCKMVPVPGLFEAGSETSRVNFFNGLRVGTRFITNQASGGFECLQESFERAVRATNPDLQIFFVGEPIIQDILQVGSGLHCITREIL